MSSLRHVEHCISRQKAFAHLNAYVTPPAIDALRKAATDADNGAQDRPLAGRLISLKDNISSPAEPTTCCSAVLASYHPTHPSTVATLLSSAGALVAGKTRLDEFGMGSHTQPPLGGGVVSHLTIPSSPGAALSPGGSSGGSAVAVATGQCFAALGTDTGGSVRLPAAWTGAVGFKPSYGRVSRWGVVDYANSLDTVGVLARTVADVRDVFRVLDREDERDGTCLSARTRARMERARPSRKGRLRVGVPVEWNVEGLSREVKSAWVALLDRLQGEGHELHPVSLPTTSLALGAYYILAPAEASSNLARYDGVRYGHRAEGIDYADTRAAFGPEVRRRILLGTYTLSAAAMENYFIAAQRVRRAVQKDFDRAFSMENVLSHRDAEHEQTDQGVDVLIGPTVPTLPPKLEDVRNLTPLEAYTADALTVPASLAGLPAISIPVGVPDLERTVVDGVDTKVWSAGMQVVGQFGDDETVLEVGKLIEALGEMQ